LAPPRLSDAQRVPGADRGQHRARGAPGPARLEGLPQVLDVGLDDVDRARRRLRRPQPGDQLLPAHRMTAGQGQQREDRPPLRRAEEQFAAPPGPHRTQ
jgi:hypothetical protein